MVGRARVATRVTVMGTGWCAVMVTAMVMVIVTGTGVVNETVLGTEAGTAAASSD
jgi:hypothetical protein